ncbi:hypothetical protein MF271_13485 [Deinococcus sp. KNUC1210]|uniref:DUF7933 domain-containing protein n=1 Tax=Deinococcus sp. KNUC1210 TaxID=2917691 RepID=UPI001EEFECAE|nr:hypothetical protein [Deinococcus sp. KNUC1210]ULH14969.1 hypothetical protein MF271_13485 [Deinococcus sp. KNUC1210]
MIGKTLKARLLALRRQGVVALSLAAGLLGSAALAQTSSGSYCTAVYGVGGTTHTITFFNTTTKTATTLSTNSPAADMNAAAVDRTDGKLYYVDRGSNPSVLYSYDPMTQTHTAIGNFYPPRDLSSNHLIAGAFDESGTYYLYYDNGQYTTINKTTAQISGYRYLQAPGYNLATLTNGDLAFDGTQGYAIFETGSERQTNVFKFNPANVGAELSNPLPLKLNGQNVTSTEVGGVNGLAYEPSAGTFYISAAGGVAGSAFYKLDITTGNITLVNNISNITDLSSCSRPRPLPPSISKAFSPRTAVSPAANGETVSRLSITINNPNNGLTYLNSDFTDTFPTSPSQMAVSNTPNLTISPAGCLDSSTVSAPAGATSLTVRSGTSLDAGACTVSVDVTVSKSGQYVNTIGVNALDTTTGKNSVAATDTLTVKTVDVKVEKSGPASAAVATPFTFSITTTNVGTSDAPNVVTSDVLPSQLNFVSADNGGTYNSSTRTITWPTLTTLAVGAKQVYTVTVFAQPVSVNTTVTNTATTTADRDLNTANNTATANVALVAGTPSLPDSGTCTPSAPYVQSFNTAGALAEVRNHVYLSDPNAVTVTDGSYNVWNQINNSGTTGYALYYNIANFEGKNGATLTTPGLLYESQIAVPVGSTVTYENYIRSHASSVTQLQYRFYDGVSGALLKSFDGAFATTSYSKQTVPSFVSPSAKLIIRLYTLKDGTTADTNVLKLDDIKLSCINPVTPALSIVKTHSPATFQVLQPATYTLTVSNAANTIGTSGTITVQDKLPVGIGASLPSGFSPAPGWTCTYSGEVEQKTGYSPNPNEAQLLTCTTTNVLATGASVALSIPVNVTSTAGASVINQASVGGGGDPDALPAAATCTPSSQCAQDTAPVLPLPTPPATCTTGTPTNLLTSSLKGYYDNDSATQIADAALLSNAAAYLTGTGDSGSFVIDGTYFFNNGYGPLSKASILQLLVNGTVYASFLTQDDYSGSATVTAQNGATLVGGVSSVQLNRFSSSRVWVTLPASVTTIGSVQLKFVSSAPAGSVGDDYGFEIGSVIACTKALPKLNVVKTVQNITAQGTVGTLSTGKPGDVLEYCITTTNTGGASATKLSFSDAVPSNTSAQTGGYGAGKDIHVTTVAGTTDLTFAADADAGQLGGRAISVNLSSLVLAPTQSFSVCFRATIN